MVQNRVTEMELGEKGSEGYTLTLVRGYDDGTSEYIKKFVEIVCYGVVDVDIQDPYDMGAKNPNALCKVHFSTGESCYVKGTITEISVE